MEKTLAFADAHWAGKDSYRQLLGEAIRQDVKEIVFLGDIDHQENFRNFMEFMRYAEEAGIPVHPVRGNHEQAWLDFATGVERICVVKGRKTNLDPDIHRIKSDTEVIEHLNSLPHNHTIDDILFTHALPRGRIRSGPTAPGLAPKGPDETGFMRRGDHKAIYRNLWHYSFNTFDFHTQERMSHVGKFTDMTEYDPEVIAWNATYLHDKGLRFMVKGHEHLHKVWYLERTLDASNGLRKNPGDMVILSSPAIVSVGEFALGHYAILEKQYGALKVEFKQLPTR